MTWPLMSTNSLLCPISSERTQRSQNSPLWKFLAAAKNPSSKVIKGSEKGCLILSNSGLLQHHPDHWILGTPIYAPWSLQHIPWLLLPRWAPWRILLAQLHLTNAHTLFWCCPTFPYPNLHSSFIWFNSHRHWDHSRNTVTNAWFHISSLLWWFEFGAGSVSSSTLHVAILHNGLQGLDSSIAFINVVTNHSSPHQDIFFTSASCNNKGRSKQRGSLSSIINSPTKDGSRGSQDKTPHKRFPNHHVQLNNSSPWCSSLQYVYYQ